jgi:hypothetical protein
MSTTADLPQPLEPFAPVCASPRFQPYRFIHKALRALLWQTLQRSGSLDAGEPDQRAQLVDEVELMLAVCADHVAHENRFFHEALRARAARAVLAFQHEHLEHLGAIADLRLLLSRLRDGPAEAAPALAYELYLRLSDFVGEQLAHMVEEETTLTRALWEHFDDAALRGFSEALHQTLSPQEMDFYLRWMARGLNGAELAQMLDEARRSGPPPAFAAMAAVMQQELGPVRWSALDAAAALTGEGT